MIHTSMGPGKVPARGGRRGWRGAAPLVPALLVAVLPVLAGCPGGNGSQGAAPPAPADTARAAAPAPATDPAARPEPSADAPAPRPGPDTVWVIFGRDTVVAELADTREEHERGLMGRREMDPGTGMLFLYEEPSVRSFWMQDTPISLDIAFLDTAFRVMDIQRMEAESTTLHSSPGPALMALEVPAGWYAEHGVRVGDVAHIEWGR